MSLNEFYKKVLTSMSLPVSEDGYIYASGGENKIMMTVEGKPMVLPTQEHINSILDTDEDGNIVVGKIPYNPLNENHIKGDTLSLKKTKLVIEHRISYGVGVAGELLLTLATNPALQKKTNLELNKFLGSINEAQNQGIKKLVDDKSIDQWVKIFKTAMSNGKGVISIFLKKSGVYNGTKYNRLATLSCPVYEELLEANPETMIYGTKLRNKDITIFKLIYEYLLDLDDKHVISIGSNDTESPGFISLFKVYLKVMTKLNNIIKMLEFVNSEVADSGYVAITVNPDELDNLVIYKQELLTIPSEVDFNRSKAAQHNSITNLQDAQAAAYSNTGTLPIVPVQQQPVTSPVPINVPLPIQHQPQGEVDPINKILYGGNPPMNAGMNNAMQNMIAPPMGMQPQMYQQPMQTMPVMQQPVNYGMPVYNQQPTMNASIYGGYPQPQQTYPPQGMFGGNGINPNVPRF